MTSESESAFIGNLIRELRNAQRSLKCLQYINADMGKLEREVHKVQKKHWHTHLSDQELVSLDTCIGNLTRNLPREVHNAQIVLTHLEHIGNNIHKLEEKARRA